MRIRNIKIDRWRHFENIELNLDDHARLVCLVGANGTGKSHLLELIASCAHKLGLSQGIEIPRGDPFADRHSFSLQFYLASGVSEAVDRALAQEQPFAVWDRTLTIRSQRNPDSTSVHIGAGGIVDAAQSVNFGLSIVRALQRSEEVHFLSLDADRAYPKKNVNIHEIAQAYEINWETTEYTRGRSFKTTTTLYDEWIKYFLAQENQAGTRLIRETRRAREGGQADPIFDDHLNPYKEALRKVLPHLVFTGVDSRSRTLIFDTTGLALAFDQLSGGEREIAFLVGQIDRFGLRRGIFLLDEPELHLNSDLIRNWVSYLTSTMETGQIWLATHSLEAVEAAGQHATFVLERNDATRKVDSIARLDTRPVLSALSRAVGTPAFSISQLLFIFIEGEEGVGERERFLKLAGLPQSVRFMECGSCNEVLRRVLSIRTIASEARTDIRIGGVVDRDFRSDTEADRIVRMHGVFVLPVHEAENFFLHPPTLRRLLDQNGLGADPLEAIRTSSDARAGSWVFQLGMSTRNAKELPEISRAAKDRAKGLTWNELNADRLAAVQSIVGVSGYDIDDQRKLAEILRVSVEAYAQRRQRDDLWKFCEGKQVLNEVARAAGFSDTAVTTRNVFVGGVRGGMFTALGVSTGLLIWSLAASAGITALLVASEPLFFALKLAGGAYLVYLGIHAIVGAIRAGNWRAAMQGSTPRRRMSAFVAYRQGLLSDLGNPKIAVFFASLLPQFVPQAATQSGGASFVDLAVLGLTFAAITLVWLVFYTYLLATAGNFMQRPKVRRILEAVTGTILVALGLRLATEPR